MNAFIVRISEFLQIKRLGTHDRYDDFDQSIQQYLIPKYQREYKWGEDKVLTLLQDVASQSKFLGLITVDPKNGFYEIVDGQQRLTTIILTFVALFNALKLDGTTDLGAEQTNILHLLQNKASQFILRNNTIGDFLILTDNEIKVQINPELDVYHQKDTFERLYALIEDRVAQLPDLIEFRNKLLDSEILLLFSDETGYSKSIEQMYLDINDKLQGLDVEDIFKGFCFQNYNREDHDDLKDRWVELKTIGFQFVQFGYTDLSEYIYAYLLSRKGYYDIPQNLKIQNKHVLSGLNADETKAILEDMVDYGSDVLRFYQELGQDTYQFQDLCPHTSTYPQRQYYVLKKMCKAIISTPVAQYYKFPFFMLIHHLVRKPALCVQLTFDDLKKLITNYYLYAFFFLQSGVRKSKSTIDKTVFEILNDDAPDQIKRIIRAVQTLRSRRQRDYEVPRNFNENYSYALYSVIDFYDAPSNFLPVLYSSGDQDTLEHLIIHQHRTKRVEWAEPGNELAFDLNEFPGSSGFRKCIVNSLILKAQLNESLGHLDLVTKISMIENAFPSGLPAHVDLLVRHIKSMKTYQILEDLKGKHFSREEIETCYHEFVEDYFSEENQEAIRGKLAEAFQRTLAGQAVMAPC